ncbi:PLP-dependent aminotransferase family protein [Pseudodesulfovibrio sp.]|uniref:aminotransferase-like domain-containing protein n=1 Tax=unclassified Pseudodesulfovibrio TaxID=2661612 RepID=UPI003AFF946A
MTIYLPHLDREDRPLYQALADAIERDVASGALPPGTRLPTHRELADGLGLNVSTVTRGYREAENRGLVSATVGRGTFVAADAATATAMVAFEPAAPGTIDMALASPLSSLDPDLSEGFRRIARRKAPNALLRYTDPRGLLEHREAGAQWAGRYGMQATAADMIVCAGSQHALTCCLTGLLRPGDRVAADALTYPGIKTLAAMLGIRIVPIAMDDQGMVPESLDAACRRDTIKAVYLIPGVHNPTTVTMPAARREALAALARKHDLTIIEDDAYALTVPVAHPPVAALAPERTAFIAGLSKSVAAGLRVAFIAAPRQFLKPLAESVLNTIWMAPPLNAELATAWIIDGTADRTMETKRAEAARRYMLACNAFENLRFRGKSGSYYLWLDLPAPWTGQAFETRARQHGVNTFGAQKFAVGETKPPNAARISLTGENDLANFKLGLHILADILSGKP